MFVHARPYKVAGMAVLGLTWLVLLMSTLDHGQMEGVQGASLPATDCTAVPQAHHIFSYTVHYAGSDREVYILEPASYSSTLPTPLVFAFHGGGGSALEWLCRHADIREVAEAAGFLLVYPNGSPLTSQNGFYWNVAENVPYTEYLMDWLVGRYNVDQARIYATGFSGGAQHTWELVGDPLVSRRLAAIGTVAGKMGGTGYLTAPHSNLEPDVTLGEPTSGYLLHGALDEREPIQGEQITNPAPLYSISLAEKTQIYAAHLGASFQQVETITHGLMVSTYANTSSGQLLKSAVDPTLHHAWPDYPLMDQFWAFFQVAPRQSITHNTGSFVHLAMLNAFQPAVEVQVGSVITLETMIWNSGGASVNLARRWSISESFPTGFQLLGAPVVETLAGNVIPLHSTAEQTPPSWHWQGVLGQDAIVRIRAPGRVVGCSSDGLIHSEVLIFRHDPITPMHRPQPAPWAITVTDCDPPDPPTPTVTPTTTPIPEATAMPTSAASATATASPTSTPTATIADTVTPTTPPASSPTSSVTPFATPPATTTPGPIEMNQRLFLPVVLR